MPFTAGARNYMLEAIRSRADSVSLHTADPGATGANEVAGGNPAYARVAIAFNAAAAGTMDDSTNGATFNVPAGVTVTHGGLWDTTPGVPEFLGGFDLPDESFTGQGQYVIDDLDAAVT